MRNDVIGFMRSIYSPLRIYLDGSVLNNIATDVVPEWTDNHSEDGICWMADVFKVCFAI